MRTPPPSPILLAIAAAVLCSAAVTPVRAAIPEPTPEPPASLLHHVPRLPGGSVPVVPRLIGVEDLPRLPQRAVPAECATVPEAVGGWLALRERMTLRRAAASERTPAGDQGLETAGARVGGREGAADAPSPAEVDQLLRWLRLFDAARP
jgi:hypothetical protein